ncbi:MAG: hypothetical protein HoeaKO_42690 [Hoeflea alexandrii]
MQFPDGHEIRVHIEKLVDIGSIGARNKTRSLSVQLQQAVGMIAQNTPDLKQGLAQRDAGFGMIRLRPEKTGKKDTIDLPFAAECKIRQKCARFAAGELNSLSPKRN